MEKTLSTNAGEAREAGSIPRSGRSPGIGNGNPLQYSCLGNSMERGAWWATAHVVTWSQTWLNSMHVNPFYSPERKTHVNKSLVCCFNKFIFRIYSLPCLQVLSICVCWINDSIISWINFKWMSPNQLFIFIFFFQQENNLSV